MEQMRKSSPSTVTRNSQMWFTAIYEQHTMAPPEPFLGPIEAGKLYTYIYDPKHAKDLPFYDTFPMFLSMGHLQNGNIFGINLSYIPPRIRMRILDKFVRVFHTRFIKNNVIALERGKPEMMKEIPFFYDVAKQMLAGSGFEFAIRSYLHSHVRSAPRVVTYEDYWRLLAFASDDIQKLNIRAIYALYKGQPIGTRDRKINMDPRVRQHQRAIRDMENRRKK